MRNTGKPYTPKQKATLRKVAKFHTTRLKGHPAFLAKRWGRTESAVHAQLTQERKKIYGV